MCFFFLFCCVTFPHPVSLLSFEHLKSSLKFAFQLVIQLVFICVAPLCNSSSSGGMLLYAKQINALLCRWWQKISALCNYSFRPNKKKIPLIIYAYDSQNKLSYSIFQNRGNMEWFSRNKTISRFGFFVHLCAKFQPKADFNCCIMKLSKWLWWRYWQTEQY